eukprot:gene18942-22668_t
MKDIWRAARKGDIKSIKKYIPATIKVDEFDKEAKTALHYAVEGDQLEVASYLLDCNANVNQKDPKGDTVKYKEAVNKRFKPRVTTIPQQKVLAPTPASPAPALPNLGAMSLTPQLPNPDHEGTSITPISPPSMKPQTNIITTVAPAPLTSASGAVYTRPLALDVVPRSLMNDDYQSTKDISSLWLEITYKLSIVAVCSEKIRYDDISKATDDAGNVLAHFLAIIGDPESSSFMETMRNQEAVATIHERVRAVRDGIKLRLFSRIDHAEVVRLVAALVGALHWLYVCWWEVTQNDINMCIAECALSCRLAMNAVTYSTPVPHGVLTNIAKLTKQISARIFVCRSPVLAKRLSDASQLVGRTFKSLLVLSLLTDDTAQRSPENLIALGKVIAEQLSLLKNITSTMVASKVSGHLVPDDEKGAVESASKQLRGSIDFYKSNAALHGEIPSEGTVLPLLASIQKSIQSLNIYSSVEKDIQMVIPAQMIAQDVHEIRSIIRAFQEDPSQNMLSEELNDQLSVTLDCCSHFACQLLFSVSAVICHNQVSIGSSSNLGRLSHLFRSGQTPMGSRRRVRALSVEVPKPEPSMARKAITHASRAETYWPKVKYTKVKRSLKRALEENYREIEVLKEYITLNHTAFRKIFKKYDKIPHLLRALQSIRRYRDTKQNIHMMNCGKYSMSILASASSAIAHATFATGGGKIALTVIWIILASLSSFISCAWDFLMDWGILHSNCKNFLLRDHLLYRHKSVYYWAMVSNVLLRVSWAVNLSFESYSSRQKELIVYATAVLEITRRFQWNCK